MQCQKWGALLVLLATSVTAFAGDFEDAVAYEKKGMNAKAVLSYFSAAKSGDARAIRELAMDYFQGAGVEKDEGKSIRLMEIAADLGDTKAQVLYGAMCLQRIGNTCNRGDTHKAYSWFLVAGDDAVRKMGYSEVMPQMNSELDQETYYFKIDARLEARRMADAWKARQEQARATAAASAPHGTTQGLSPEYLGTLETTVQVADIESRVQQEDAQLQKKNEQQKYAKQLRTGEVKIANIKDAWLAQENVSDLMVLMASPLVKPNNAIYGARLTLDAEERKGVLRAKWDMDSTESVLESPLIELSQETYAKGAMRISNIRQQFGGSVYYVQLKQSKKTVAFTDDMRIGQSVWVIGRYVANSKFRRVSGTEGTMPVLEVLYIGE